MAQITGKIYQMYNKETGANKERRFPITVTEAVLGLSSYLQDQFSALADIYMPIEGIYEALTGQEFVFRKSPNTIKAKSLTIDRIKGKTIAWNQLQNSVSPNPGLWSGYTTSQEGNYTVFTWDQTQNFSRLYLYSFARNSKVVISGHKYFVSVFVKKFRGISILPPTSNIILSVYGERVILCHSDAFVEGAYFAQILSSNVTTTEIELYQPAASDQGVTIEAGGQLSFWVNCIDLTLMFGAGNEPSTVAEFEALYSDTDYTYNPGTLISNDAEGIETTGVNQWDEEWEVGLISTTGTNVSDVHHIRSKNYIKVIPGESYYFTLPTGKFARVIGYDGNKNFIRHFGNGVGQIAIEMPQDVEYLRFCVYSDSYGTIYNHDICINLSDTSFNGQYEPYRKSTLPLNLDDFWVKDGQGNQMHITGGLKSVPGSVDMRGNILNAAYDEIHNGKFIQRIERIVFDGTENWKKSSNIIVLTNWYANHPTPYFKTYVPNVGQGGSGLCSLFGQSQLTNGAVGNRYSLLVGDKNWGFDISSNIVGDITVEQFKAQLASLYAAGTPMTLDYVLATPIEYELVEPLIYTMKAGTTEERISPNSDGLSAPFCCDMTYSANENNDAGNAQYAATAGRLLNTRKIWGQDFNGSEDVDGNLVSNGILQGTQLKSTVPTGTAPLVVSSTTTVANLVAEKASKLLTARTIWGQSFDGSGNISGAISNITTISASGLATISGGIALGTSTKAQAAKMVWEEADNAWHLKGNLYVDGFVTAGGINNQE